MAINLNPKDVRKVKVSTTSLPKTIVGKNDRVKMVQGLEHGHTYKVGIKVIYNDWSEYNTTFTIVRILENRTVVEVKDNGERFGTFVLNLNSLIQENIKGKVQEQNKIYLKHMEQMQAEFDKKFNEEKLKADSETAKWHNAYTKEFKRSNELQEKLTEKTFALMNTETQLWDLQDSIKAVMDVFRKGHGASRTGKQILRMVRFATIKGIDETEIEKMIDEQVNKKVAAILEEKLGNN